MLTALVGSHSLLRRRGSDGEKVDEKHAHCGVEADVIRLSGVGGEFLLALLVPV
jgi:hypothetical protein